ncbi:MAG: hypothetical protein HFH99_11855 [Lachnospiraceae bacterium]|nr:DUF6591 domain-containing protein [uncultured Acetatifactor sp.]MCI8697449.1 hypothetical protein [Lachnospiraceae bacterium]MCI9575059.1 hypothetical protein [Lachnospiraceae bacterium]
MLEIFGTKGMVVTYDIVTYLSSMVAEAFSAVVGESGASVLDLAAEYRKLAEKMQERLNGQMEAVGIEFSDILIENISLPDEVEKLIDEQSGISVANQDAVSDSQGGEGGVREGRRPGGIGRKRRNRTYNRSEYPGYDRTERRGFEDYVEECKDAGFTVDYSRQDSYYLADDGEGYSLSLMFDKDGEELTIYLSAPEPGETEGGKTEPGETESSAPESDGEASEPPEEETGESGDELESAEEALTKAGEMEEKFEAWEGDMNDAELKHYTEVQLGISQKLLETSTEMQE